MRIYIILMLLPLLSGCGNKKQDHPSPAGDKDYSALTPVMQQALPQLGGNAGLMLVARDGTVLYKQYFGSYDDQTYLPIASGSKWISAAAIMALVEDPQLSLSLDDRVTDYFPVEFGASDRRDITLRQLMSHTSGLAGSSRWISTDAVSLLEAVRGIGYGGNMEGAQVAPAGTPHGPAGSKFAYGGVSLHVAGGIAEKATGKTWDQIFRERIGAPCNMPNTDYTGLGPTSNYRIAGGAGTRMTEYANFLMMLLNNGLFNGRQVLSPASVDEILKDQTGTAPLTFTPYESDPLRKGFRYGLGCWIEGGTNGAPAEFSCQGAFGFSPWVDRERGIAGVLFVQRTLAAVNRTPSPGQSPYTVIRQKVREIANAR